MPSVDNPPWREVPGGLTLSIRATPRASSSQIAGTGTDTRGRPMLLVRIAAPPVEGAANAALVELLAGTFDLRKREISIASGDKGRTKQVLIRGDAPALVARLNALLRP